MGIGSHELEIKLVRGPDRLELDLLPLQGLWTEQQYLKLTDQTNHLVEFTDGSIEILPMPTRDHQLMLLMLYELLKAFLQPRGGTALVAPLRVQIHPGKYREPDVLAMLDVADPRNQNAYWLGADIVMEIVSPDDPERDTVEKVVDYAQAGIPEYWIVNPIDQTITVLALHNDRYAQHGIFRNGETATSVLLDSFEVHVDAVFNIK